jgi:hypothetical protein
MKKSRQQHTLKTFKELQFSRQFANESAWIDKQLFELFWALGISLPWCRLTKVTVHTPFVEGRSSAVRTLNPNYALSLEAGNGGM